MPVSNQELSKDTNSFLMIGLAYNNFYIILKDFGVAE
jgi:hypothetical protein